MFIRVGRRRVLLIVTILVLATCFLMLLLLKPYPVNPNSPYALWRSKVNCDWNKVITGNTSGIYEFILCYNVRDIENGLEETELTTIQESKIRINGSNKMLTFEELSKIPDNEWLPDFDTSVYKLYPQTIPLNETTLLIKLNKSLKKPPINNPTIRFLQVPSKVCPPVEIEYSEIGITNVPHHDVVIIYKSAVYNFESRNRIRKFYHLDRYDLKIDLVFSIGMPTTMESNVFQRDGFNVTLTGRAGKKMLEHIQSPQETFDTLKQEMKEHHDLLIGDYEDTYFNLTLKLFHSYHWAAQFCRRYNPIFIFMEDDYAVNPKKLVDYLKGLTPIELHRLNNGFERPENVVFRPSNPVNLQWTFSKKEIPWPTNMPEYLGSYNLFGYSVVEDIAIGMYFTKPIVSDNTFLAIIMNKLNLPLLGLDRMTFGDMLPKRRHACTKILFATLDVFEARRCSF